MTSASERSRPRWIASLTLLALLALHAPAHALEEVDSETRSIARELALQGAEAYEKHDYHTALDRFQRASTLFRAPSITVMLARSLAQLGRFLEALDRYEETQRLPLPPDAPEAFQLAVDDARSEARALRARIPRLEVRTSGGTPAPGLRVTLDGRPVAEALLNVERPIDPGSHVLAATAPGMSPFQQDFSLNEGERRVISLPLLSPALNRTTTPVSQDTTPNARHTGSGRAWGYALAGVGVAGLGFGAITGAVALSRKSDLDEVCRPGCPASSADDISSFRLNRTLSYAGFGLGALALGIGGYVLLTSSPSHPVTARITPGGVQVGGSF
ncbi:MAG: tetratricopeptide repeat protein [Myxococcota bacterium]